jgi:hypothetical protein
MEWRRCLAGVGVLAVTACTSSHGAAGTRSPLVTPTATATNAADSLTLSRCLATPASVAHWFRAHANPELWTVATIRVRGLPSSRQLELVGIYTGSARIALLGRAETTKRGGGFMALNDFSRRLTGFPENRSLAAGVGPHVIEALRECFPS